MATKTGEQIIARMKSHNTLLCCGLDPDLRKFPVEIIEKQISDEEKVLDFLKNVIDITASHVCAYKIQKAFFDIFPNGHNALKEVISYIHQSHPNISVIVDCKIGDIDNTMQAYVHNLFDVLQADGIVVNPYMGDDVIMPLAKFTNKAIIVLVRTSNPSGGIIQDIILKNGQPFWHYILSLVIDRWNYNSNMIPVISSTTNMDMEQIRSMIPDNMPIFLAGVGSQGGSYFNLKKLVNSDGVGVMVNSSRDILYPQVDGFWRASIKKATISLKESLNEARGAE
ncbi:MAG: orotidine-5'-phosphate decarboxylase [Candidatus Pacebacteria bacterium]|nr:orotidine-5'-phosphate decarboxylase [Candidatus Paceibacterota bacterium]